MAFFIEGDDFASWMEETDPKQNVRKASDYQAQVVDYFHGGIREKCDNLPWRGTVGKLGFREGEVTLWGGFNGGGKSLVLGQACVGFVRQHKRVVIASMEMKPVLTCARMIRQEYGIKPEKDAIKNFHQWTDNGLWLYAKQGAVAIKMMLAVIRYSAEVLKANHFVVDSLMRCGLADDDYTGQKNFISSLCDIAQDTGIHIHIVAHSRKLKDETQLPSKMDVKGSGTMTDLVDNVITVWRNKKKEDDPRLHIDEASCVLIVDKQRNGEWEGKIGLNFNQEFTRFDE